MIKNEKENGILCRNRSWFLMKYICILFILLFFLTLFCLVLIEYLNYAILTFLLLLIFILHISQNNIYIIFVCMYSISKIGCIRKHNCKHTTYKKIGQFTDQSYMVRLIITTSFLVMSSLSVSQRIMIKKLT